MSIYNSFSKDPKKLLLLHLYLLLRALRPPRVCAWARGRKTASCHLLPVHASSSDLSTCLTRGRKLPASPKEPFDFFFLNLPTSSLLLPAAPAWAGCRLNALPPDRLLSPPRQVRLAVFYLGQEAFFVIRTMSMTFRFDRRLCSSGSRRPIAIEAAI